jgi:hypothetical protein
MMCFLRNTTSYDLIAKCSRGLQLLLSFILHLPITTASYDVFFWRNTTSYDFTELKWKLDSYV